MDARHCTAENSSTSPCRPLCSSVSPLHTSSRRCVGYAYSPESLTYVSSSGLAHLPPSCNSNYLGVLLVSTTSEDHIRPFFFSSSLKLSRVIRTTSVTSVNFGGSTPLVTHSFSI